jgi:hypothetical protein
MLATATICSALSFGAAAQAASSHHHHHSKSKSSKSTQQSDKSADTSDDKAVDKTADTSADQEQPANSEDSTTTTTTTTSTTDDKTSGGGSNDSTTTETAGTSGSSNSAAPGDSGSAGTAATATTADPAAGSDAPADSNPTPPQPVVVQPVQPVAVTPPQGGGSSVVFLPMVSAQDHSEYGYRPPIGIALMAGGGSFKFVGGDLRAETNLGGEWTVRALVGSRSIVGVEAAYLGTAQEINALGLANNATLISNGVEGTLRVNAPIGIRHFLIEPFAFGGGGWTHYNIVNSSTNSASLRTTDNVVLVPVGGGIDMGYRGFFLDARYTYRFSYNNDLVQVGDRGMDNWSASGALGYEF